MNSIKRWWCKHFHGCNTCVTFSGIAEGKISYHCRVCGRYWVEWRDTFKKPVTKRGGKKDGV